MALAWFPCYVNDLLGSLSWRCMTPAQRGAYWQLICCQMQAEDGTLPDGIAMLSRLADLDLSGENSVVLDKFPVTESGKRANPRAYSEWLKRQDISEKRSNAGAIGGASKKQLPEQMPKQLLDKPEADAPVLPPTTTTTSTGTGNTPQEHPEQKKTRPRADAALFRWDEFASIYPTTGMTYDSAARNWWAKNVHASDDALVDSILAGVRRWNASERHKNGFVANCGKFLREGVYLKPTPDDSKKAKQSSDMDDIFRGCEN